MAEPAIMAGPTFKARDKRGSLQSVKGERTDHRNAFPLTHTNFNRYGPHIPASFPVFILYS